MKTIEIAALENGAHNNQTTGGPIIVPQGWAVVPDDMTIPETYPFVDITVKNGIVTAMTARIVPEPVPAEPEEPDTEADMLETILDHEARLAALELVGGGEG